MIFLRKLHKYLIISLPFVLLFFYIIRWLNSPTFNLIRYNVNLNNLRYVTYTTRERERYKLTPETDKEILRRLIRSLKYAPPRIGYAVKSTFEINMLKFYLSNSAKAVSIKIGDTAWECPWHFSDQTLKMTDEIVEKKIGLNRGVYLLPEPNKLTILQAGASPVEISKKTDGWEELINLARFSIQHVARLVEINYSDAKNVWIDRAKYTKYTLKITYKDPVKLSLCYRCRFSDFDDTLRLRLPTDDYGAPVVEAKEIFVSPQISGFVIFRCLDNDELCLFGGSHSSLGKSFREVRCFHQKILDILDSYYRVGPTAEIKGFEKNQ